MDRLAEGVDLVEVVRVQRGRLVRLRAHARRMAASARELRFLREPARDDEELASQFAEALRAKADAGRIRDGLLELRLARGGDPRAVPLAVVVTGDPFLEPFGPDALAAGLRLIVASAARDEHDPRSRHKTSDRAAAHAARAEALAAGADEALLVNRAGRVAGAVAANVFVLDASGLRTPPPSEGALPGVTRAALIEAARSLGVPVSETPLSVNDLLAAPDLLLTASAYGLLSVRSLQGRDLAPPRAGTLRKGLVPRLRLRLHELGE